MPWPHITLFPASTTLPGFPLRPAGVTISLAAVSTVALTDRAITQIASSDKPATPVKFTEGTFG
jgi:hypothetical protein